MKSAVGGVRNALLEPSWIGIECSAWTLMGRHHCSRGEILDRVSSAYTDRHPLVALLDPLIVHF